jgi:hypothetical protein
MSHPPIKGEPHGNQNDRTAQPQVSAKTEDESNLKVEDAVDLIDPKNLLKRLLRFGANLFRQSPRVFAGTALVFLIAIAAARMVGYDPVYFIPAFHPIGESYNHLPILRGASWVPEFSARQDCVSRAKELKRPYVLENVVQWVHYGDDTSGPTPIRRVHERIFYRVLPLKDIKEGDEIFLEEYEGDHLVRHWLGPHREIPEGGGNKYQVAFTAKRGELETLVTGADFEYSLPLAEGRAAFRSKVTVNRDRDFWYYQNIDDVVCELTQIIESDKLHLAPVGRGGVRIGGTDTAAEGDVQFQANPSIKGTNTALLMDWRTVLPGEDVGIVFSWR